MNSAPLAALALALTLAACGSAEKPEAPEKVTTVTTEVTTDGTGTTTTEEQVVFSADDKTGELSVSLKDGTGASLRLPPEVVRKMGEDSKVDIDGVSLFPGGRVTAMAISRAEKDGQKKERADISFAAPATPDAVAQWYVAAFREKGHQASRQGNSVAATTTEGSQVRIDLEPEGEGTKGTIKVEETGKG
jgi:hypothetical protein